MKQREKIIFTEEELENFPESLPEKFNVVEEEQTEFDAEKGFCYYSVVLEDIETGKFYRGEYIELGINGTEANPEFKEVFPKTITTTIYE